MITPTLNGFISESQNPDTKSTEGFLEVCSSSYSTLGAFIEEHQQNLSYNLIVYLNPAIFIALANKEDHTTFTEVIADFAQAMETDVFDFFPKPKHKVISSVLALSKAKKIFRWIHLETQGLLFREEAAVAGFP